MSRSAAGEADDEVHRVEHDLIRPVVEGVSEPKHDLPAVIDRVAFVSACRAGDVAGALPGCLAVPTRSQASQERSPSTPGRSPAQPRTITGS